jgi:hypothetical protein
MLCRVGVGRPPKTRCALKKIHEKLIDIVYLYCSIFCTGVEEFDEVAGKSHGDMELATLILYHAKEFAPMSENLSNVGFM